MKIFRLKLTVIFLVLAAWTSGICLFAQEFIPTPPTDRTLVYSLNNHNELAPLPSEMPRTPLDIKAVAKNTKTSYLEIQGEHATTTLDASPRLFFFTKQGPGRHPPFLVWLTPRRGARRVTALTQAGMAGLSISSDEIVKPIVRVIASFGDEVFMELRPRTSLVPGEYAIIGDDVTRIATFRVIAETMR